MDGGSHIDPVALVGLSAFLGGLSGAFFAFIFGRVASMVDRNRRRWKQHYDALVRLESFCNEIFSFFPDNSKQFEILLEVCRAIPNGPTFSWNQPTRVPTEPGVMTDLLCLQTKNLLFGLCLKIRRLNDAIDVTNRATASLHESLVAGRISPETYKAKLRSIGSEIPAILHFIKMVDDYTADIAAHVRVLLKKDRNKRWTWQFLFRPRPSKVTEKEKSTELSALRGEMNEIVSESKAELVRRNIIPTSENSQEGCS